MRMPPAEHKSLYLRLQLMFWFQEDVKKIRCEADGCAKQPSFGFLGERPRRCKAHMLEGMVRCILHPFCAGRHPHPWLSVLVDILSYTSARPQAAEALTPTYTYIPCAALHSTRDRASGCTYVPELSLCSWLPPLWFGLSLVHLSGRPG